MGCCNSRPDDFQYPSTQEGNSSSRAITSSQPNLNPTRPSASSHSNRPHGQGHGHGHGHISQPLSAHIDRPLKPHVWSSKERLWTRGELDAEREAYFDTRVTGRPEIWSAIRAALEIVWAVPRTVVADPDSTEGYATAQMILTAADVTIPTGDLASGVYDRLGAFYPLPEYVVSDPINLAIAVLGALGEDDKSEGERSEEEIRTKDGKGKGVMVDLRARLSDNGGNDVLIKFQKDESVRLVTRRILEASGHSPPTHLKLAYRGKLLAAQQSLVDQGWKEGDVINAMVFTG